MYTFSILTFVLFLGFSTESISAVKKDKVVFCQSRQTQPEIIKLLRSPANLLPSKNAGGLFGLQTGVCWWHSRLQRRLTYLAKFRPDLPRPSDSAVRKILRQIKQKERVIEIPGFKDVNEFGKVHAKLIQKTLNAWMAGDSILRFTWIKGLQKKRPKDEAYLKAHLAQLYAEFKQSPGIMMQVLDFKGISAHSWLITDMKKDVRGDYIIEIIDSNKPQSPIRFTTSPRAMNPEISQDITYTSPGDQYANPLKHPLFKYPEFIGITNFQKEERQLKVALQDYCK